MSELLPVFELECAGFTHLSCACTTCGHLTALAFHEVRSRVPVAAWCLTTEELARYLGCVRCGGATAIIAEKRARVLRGGWAIKRRA